MLSGFLCFPLLLQGSLRYLIVPLQTPLDYLFTKMSMCYDYFPADFIAFCNENLSLSQHQSVRYDKLLVVKYCDPHTNHYNR